MTNPLNIRLPRELMNKVKFCKYYTNGTDSDGYIIYDIEVELRKPYENDGYSYHTFGGYSDENSKEEYESMISFIRNAEKIPEKEWDEKHA